MGNGYPASQGNTSSSGGPGSYQQSQGMPAPSRESLGDHMRDLASAFSEAASVLSYHYTTLDNGTKGLLDGINVWSGKGATGFSEAWYLFGQYMQTMQQAGEDTHNALIKYASKLDDIESQEGWDFLMTVVGGVLTIVSFAAAIAEMGLNPFVDGFLAFCAGFTEQDGAAVANTAEDITQADNETAIELQAIEDDLTVSPTLTGSTPNAGGPANAIAPLNLDEMLLTVAEDNTQSDFFQLDLSNGEPGSTIDEVGQKYLDELKQASVVIDDSPDTQQWLKMNGARGSTWNDNLPTDPHPGPQGVTILLGENANNATIYEEYLHYQDLKARNWVGVSPGSAEYYMEEIKVEQEVLDNATMLKMTAAEQAELRLIRQGYIDRLYDEYGIQMH